MENDDGSSGMHGRKYDVQFRRRAIYACGDAGKPYPYRNAGRHHHGLKAHRQYPSIWNVLFARQSHRSSSHCCGTRRANPYALRSGNAEPVGARCTHGPHREHAGSRFEL